MNPDPAGWATSHGYRPTHRNLEFTSIHFQVNRNCSSYERMVAANRFMDPAPFKAICRGFVEVAQE